KPLVRRLLRQTGEDLDKSFTDHAAERSCGYELSTSRLDELEAMPGCAPRFVIPGHLDLISEALEHHVRKGHVFRGTSECMVMAPLRPSEEPPALGLCGEHWRRESRVVPTRPVPYVSSLRESGVRVLVDQPDSHFEQPLENRKRAP